MKTHWRIFALLLIDTALVNMGFLIAFYVRFLDGEMAQYIEPTKSILVLGTLLYIASFYIFKLYNRVWSYASTGELLAVIYAVTVGTLAIVAISFFMKSWLPRSVIILAWAFHIIIIGGSRFAWRLYVENIKSNGVKHGRRALIVGAGAAGVMVARELSNSKHIDMRPVGFIDDDPGKRNHSLLGIPVLGNRRDIQEIVSQHCIDEIIIAMPSVDGQAIREIVNICGYTVANIKVLPGVYEILDGKVSIDRLRPLQLEDLLHREPVKVDLASIANYLKGKIVMITGAGGSIGSELCRQVAPFEPKRLIVLGHGENSIHKIWQELNDSFPEIDLVVEIADVRDFTRIEYIFKKHKPLVVFHAAAHKHVPLMEMHPIEAIKTNVLGTRNVARAALNTGAKTFILISTDKAVNPSSIMGASKLMAEILIRSLNNQSETVFAAVRFGNVLGSNGSVVPVFQRQIRQGGPVTVTHPEMTRYFMTIPEAVSLVIQAGTMAKGGEVFVLDMGNPVKIIDLAKDMIRLSGYEPDRDIEIVITGIRAGEKLHEELFTFEEEALATCHKKIFVSRSGVLGAKALEKELLQMESLPIGIDSEEVFSLLKRILPEFKGYCQKDNMTESDTKIAENDHADEFINSKMVVRA